MKHREKQNCACQDTNFFSFTLLYSRQFGPFWKLGDFSLASQLESSSSHDGRPAHFMIGASKPNPRETC